MALGAERDTATYAHDIDVQRQQQPRHRSRLTRSPSLSRSTGKRSPSPIISFHPAPLSPDNTKGVKNITRKVIKRLEELGHLEMVNMDLVVSEDEEEPKERKSNGAVEAAEDVEERVVKKVGRQAVKGAHSKETRVGTQQKSTKLKSNLEIPRKLLHSSIGLFSSSPSWLRYMSNWTFFEQGFFTLYLYISEGDARTIILVLWMALAVIVPADILRFKSRKFARLYEFLLGFLMRESEKVRFSFFSFLYWYKLINCGVHL